MGSNEKSFHLLPWVFGVILVLHGQGVLADMEDGSAWLAVDHALAGENHSRPCETRGTCEPGPREIVSRADCPNQVRGRVVEGLGGGAACYRQCQWVAAQTVGTAWNGEQLAVFQQLGITNWALDHHVMCHVIETAKFPSRQHFLKKCGKKIFYINAL